MSTGSQTIRKNRRKSAKSRVAPSISIEKRRSRAHTRMPQTINGVVLAGVHAWNRSPLNRTLPRPLLPIANQPLITYSLEWLHRFGIERACVCGNSQTEDIRRGLESDGHVESKLSFYADYMPRGPAGCVKDASRLLGQGDVIVVDGTIIPQIDLHDLMAAHADSKADLTVVVHQMMDPSGLPVSDAIPVGVYVISEATVAMIADQGYQDIKEELIPELYKRGQRVRAYVEDAPSPRVIGDASYLAVNDWMVQQIEGTGARADKQGHSWRSEVGWYDSSATIHPTAKIIGPVMIGRDVRVGANAVVVGPTSIGSNCVIGDGSVVCRSSLWDTVSIGEECLVDRSVLTSRCQLVAGASLRNAIWTPDSDASVTLRPSQRSRKSA